MLGSIEKLKCENFVGLVAGAMLWSYILFPHVFVSYNSHILDVETEIFE